MAKYLLPVTTTLTDLSVAAFSISPSYLEYGLEALSNHYGLEVCALSMPLSALIPDY